MPQFLFIFETEASGMYIIENIGIKIVARSTYWMICHSSHKYEYFHFNETSFLLSTFLYFYKQSALK